jgi:hypothetical protein
MSRPVIFLTAMTVGGLTPQGLLTALRTTPIRDAELPSGFTHAQIEKQALSKNARKYHAVGLVDAALRGPDIVDGLAWIVFTKHADAIGDLDHPVVGTNGVKVVNTVPGIKESLMLTGTLNGKKVTDAAAVVGNVLVQGVVVSSSVREPTAIILLKAAIAHLRRVR